LFIAETSFHTNGGREIAPDGIIAAFGSTWDALGL
jgi:hypothetical protein